MVPMNDLLLRFEGILASRCFIPLSLTLAVSLLSAIAGIASESPDAARMLLHPEREVLRSASPWRCSVEVRQPDPTLAIGVSGITGLSVERRSPGRFAIVWAAPQADPGMHRRLRIDLRDGAGRLVETREILLVVAVPPAADG